MFVLVKLRDTVRIKPSHLGREESEVVRDSLMAKYANKVLSEQGLGICVYDFEILHNYLYHGDGGAHVRVEFRLVVFRPSPGEVLIGKVQQCDDSGLYLSLNFFDHVLIPRTKMQKPSEFDEKEKLWVWKFEENELFMDLDCPVRFRVEKVIFADPTPKDKEKEVDKLADAKKTIAATGAQTKKNGAATEEEEKKEEEEDESAARTLPEGTTIASYRPPMLIVGSIQEDGLGLLDWWS